MREEVGDLGVVVNSPGIVVNDLGVIENEILGDASVSGLLGRQGEASFQKMKKLAEEAGWPATLTPEIVAADKGWQKAKEDVNDAGVGPRAVAAAKQMADASAKLDAMVSRLEAHLRERTSPKADRVQVPATVPPAGSGSPALPPSQADKPPSKSASDILEFLNRDYGPMPAWAWGATGLGLLTIGYFLLGRRDPR